MASPVVAQNCEFEEWDSNTDSYLDEDEFYDAYNNVGYYDVWDENDDDALTETEWEMGIDEHLNAFETGNYSDWDSNNDGKLLRMNFMTDCSIYSMTITIIVSLRTTGMCLATVTSSSANNS